MLNNTQYQTADQCSRKLPEWASQSNHKNLVSWASQKLDIKPYQHILEIGYGNGYALQEVGRVLKIGFLAGIDSSIEKHQQAYRRNRNLIKQHMLALHIGEPHDIPYPKHYFNKVFGINVLDRWKEPAYGFLQLSQYIRSSGILLMVFQSNKIAEQKLLQVKAENIRQQFATAGLQDVEIDFQFLETQMGISVKGYKE
jgi:cyclopropane fatty-acyl-phospholipid synthase-like methyltransferase